MVLNVEGLGTETRVNGNMGAWNNGNMGVWKHG